MRFIISSTTLLRNLQAINGVMSSNNTLPILDDFLFQLDEEKLLITASDNETSMSVAVQPDKSEESGSVAIPAKILLDMLKTFADIPITFTINMENFSVEIFSGEGKYKLNGHNSEEYPLPMTVDNPSNFTMNSQVIVNAVNKVLFASGTDELRQMMTGMYWDISEERIIFVATDAHKLVKYTRFDAKGEEETSFILPKKPLNNLKNILSTQDINVNIQYTDKHAVFSFGSFVLTSRLIEGKYPNYHAVIPQENPNVMTIERLPLLTTLKRVGIFANQSTHQVRFRISGKELALSAEDIDYSNEAKERLTCDYVGEDMDIGFNSKFLLEMLNNVEDDIVRIEMSQPNRAGLILPGEVQEAENEDILMLVMPVMLSK